MADDLRPTVQTLLRALPTQKVAALKQLFWAELNYDRAGVTLAMTARASEVQALPGRQAAGTETAAPEAAIDAAVYRLFGVEVGEIGVVEIEKYR